jgi:hypothetical protein
MACRGVGIPPVLLHEAGLGESGGTVDVQEDVNGVEHLLRRVAELGSRLGSEPVVQVVSTGGRAVQVIGNAVGMQLSGL